MMYKGKIEIKSYFMKNQTIILKIFGHVPAVARGWGGFWINLVSTN